MVAATVSVAAALTPMKTVEKHRLTFGTKSMPSDIVLISENDFLILDGYAGTMKRYKNGKPVQSFLLTGAKDAITVTDHNEQYYVSIAGQSIQVYDRHFRFIRKIRPKLKAFDPVDIAFHGGFAYVVDNDQHRILKLDAKTFNVVDQIGKFGFNKRQFRYPFDIEIDDRGDLFVSEVINTRVQILTPEFKYVSYLGVWGVSAGEFFRPKGIAFYKGGLLVADGYMGVIQWFNGKYQAAAVISDEAGDIRRYRSPVRVRVKDNVLAVIDYFDKTVSVYTVGD